MPNYMNQEGEFRVQITEYGLKKRDSGAVCISCMAKVLDRWMPVTDDNDGYWESWVEHDVLVYGDFYIVLSKEKGNKPNTRQIESLVEYCGWDADFNSIQSNSWMPTPCRVSVKGDTYNNETRYKMSWLNSYDSTPSSQLGTVDSTTVKGLVTQHGSSLRAIAGNVTRNKPPAVSKPVAPPMVEPEEQAAAPVASDVPEYF